MMIEGVYAYRFSGFAMDQSDTPNYLVGVGTLRFDANGVITGRQSSSITPIEGHNTELTYAVFELRGTYNFADGLGDATIEFKSVKGPAQTLRGTFDFVDCGRQERFWLISTGAQIVARNAPLGAPITADEVVSGEAVRLP